MFTRSNLLLLILILIASSYSIAGPEDWRVALCISENPAQQMNVSWRTVTELNTPLVQLALNSPQAKFNKDPRVIHAATNQVLRSDSSTVYAYSAKMKDLVAGTSYAYRMGSKDVWSEWFTFKTAEATQENFKFIYFGDPQNGLKSHVSRAFRAGYAAAPDAAFFTMAGDLVSTGNRDDQWADLFYAGSWILGQVPLVPVMGNHAYYYDNQWNKIHTTQWRPHFTLPENGLASLPETNYYFHYQGVLFIVLNGSEQQAEQAEWLDELLTRESDTWIILSMHQPLYSSKEGRDGEKLRAHFLPVIDKRKVDLVLQGHDHTFGRTFPLVKDRKASRWEKGTVYINSVAGSKQYGPGPNRADLFAVTGSDTQYYHIVEVSSKKLRLLSYSVDGTMVDEVTINAVRRN
ncbi:MAG: metallophosphoesterase family protein [Candidatus Marinimicrobia bacterium]|nr:metallophosphoesterase family protein [Candidatus Neomarinimicrobiota bacterium]